MGYSPWSHKELDMTEQLTLSLFLSPCYVLAIWLIIAVCVFQLFLGYYLFCLSLRENLFLQGRPVRKLNVEDSFMLIQREEYNLESQHYPLCPSVVQCPFCLRFCFLNVLTPLVLIRFSSN